MLGEQVKAPRVGPHGSWKVVSKTGTACGNMDDSYIGTVESDAPSADLPECEYPGCQEPDCVDPACTLPSGHHHHPTEEDIVATLFVEEDLLETSALPGAEAQHESLPTPEPATVLEPAPVIDPAPPTELDAHAIQKEQSDLAQED